MVNILINNPYRIIGVFASAMPAEITDSENKLNNALRIGQRVDTPRDLVKLLGPCKRDEQSVKEAAELLVDDSSRLLYALCWFVDAQPLDRIAFSHLISGNISTAENIWKSSDYFSSVHNLMVCAMIRGDVALFESLSSVWLERFVDKFQNVVVGHTIEGMDYTLRRNLENMASIMANDADMELQQKKASDIDSTDEERNTYTKEPEFSTSTFTTSSFDEPVYDSGYQENTESQAPDDEWVEDTSYSEQETMENASAEQTDFAPFGNFRESLDNNSQNTSDARIGSVFAVLDKKINSSLEAMRSVIKETEGKPKLVETAAELEEAVKPLVKDIKTTLSKNQDLLSLSMNEQECENYNMRINRRMTDLNTEMAKIVVRNIVAEVSEYTKIHKNNLAALHADDVYIMYVARSLKALNKLQYFDIDKDFYTKVVAANIQFFSKETAEIKKSKSNASSGIFGNISTGNANSGEKGCSTGCLVVAGFIIFVFFRACL